MKVIIIIPSFYERYFWPNLVAIEHILPHLTSIDPLTLWGYHHHQWSSDNVWQPWSIVHYIWPLLTFDHHEGHLNHKLASAVLLTKFGSHRAIFTIFDFCWPLTSTKVINIISLHQKFLWPSLVATEHCLLYLTSVDLWPPQRPSSFFSLHQQFLSLNMVTIAHSLPHYFDLFCPE